MAIADEMGIECAVADLTRSDLYVCDEMFLCGTAAEVSAVNAVDDRKIPCPGEFTSAIAAEYARVVRGEVDQFKDWVELVS
jgi:branched-chain amino acid aminotransferase